MKIKKLLAVSMATAMALSMAGCSFNVSLGGPKNAADVVGKYMEKMEDEEANYHVDLDMDFDIGAKGDGMSIELPVEMDMSVDVFGDNMHGDMDVAMSFMGQEMKTSSEIYVESGRKTTTTYTYDEESGYWTVTEEDRGADIATGISSMDVKAFENAKMEKDKDGSYVVTQSFADFAKYSDAYDSMESMYGDMASMMSMDPDDFLDEWEDAEVTYTFDKDYLLTSVEITGCEFSDTVEEEGTKVDVSVSLEVKFEYSDYGKIEEDDVEVPEKVKENAVPALSMELNEDDYHVSINGDEYGNLEMDEDLAGQAHAGYEDIDPGIAINPGEDIDPGFSMSVDEDIDPGFSVNPAQGMDIYGSYNGMPLTGMGDSFSDIFNADGWNFDRDEDGAYSFVAVVNDKYDGVDLYLYNKARNAATHADIMDDGIYGYNVDAAYMKGTTYPPMTWNGLTFGASDDDVVAAYGTPDYSYTGTMYVSYEYDLTDDIQMKFCVYPDKGLQQVQLNYYGGLQ